MKQLYLECNMGAAGDMLMGALYDICRDREAFLHAMAALDIPGVHIHADTVQKSGIGGVSVTVHIHGQEEISRDVPPGQVDEHHEHNHDHGHSHGHTHEHDHDHVHGEGHAHSRMTDIRAFIEKAPVSDRVRENALGVYQIIAEAEAAVHGTTPEQVHFHEVGTLDALADILGCCILMEMIAPDRIVCSPVHVGSGQVRCAHGILPVPAPATAYILQGVPIYGGAVRGELCTPTGAALLKHFATGFCAIPVMRVSDIGYGMGKKDFEAANCVRALLGETDDNADTIVELCCNLDDMTPEAIGFAQERLFEDGALDVFTSAVGMKKNRPGVLLSCICRGETRDEMIRLIFKHTTTLGIREYICNRYILDRSERSVQTEYGTIRVKVASGWGIKREKPEFEDVARIARKTGMPVHEVLKQI